MDGIFNLSLNRSHIIYWFAYDINNSSQSSFANRNLNRTVQINGFHSTSQAICGMHGNTPHFFLPQMLLHFNDNIYGF